MQGKHAAHRDSVLRALTLELIRNERLQSTPTKVKLLKQKFDRLVTNAKKSTDASKRHVASYLRNSKAEEKLYNVLLPRLQGRNSGYTKTARTLPRKGDNADQMIIMVHGAEIRKKQSRLQRALGTTSKKSETKDTKTTETKKAKAATAKKPVRATSKTATSSQKKESVKSVRRNSK